VAVAAGYAHSLAIVVQPPTLSIARSGANVVLTWNNGALFSSTNMTGPYTPVTGSPSSPYTVTPTEPGGFFRVVTQATVPSNLRGRNGVSVKGGAFYATGPQGFKMRSCEFRAMGISKVVKTGPRWLRRIEKAAWGSGASPENTRYLRGDFTIGFIRSPAPHAQHV